MNREKWRYDGQNNFGDHVFRNPKTGFKIITKYKELSDETLNRLENENN